MKKFLPYIFIVLILLGIFVPTSAVRAEDGICNYIESGKGVEKPKTRAECTALRGVFSPTAPDRSGESHLSQALDECGIIVDGTLDGCLQRIVYIFFVAIPSFLLSIAAKTFNMLAVLTLSSKVYDYDFIREIWQIIRDFANIAFILVLLFAAFQTILGMGHGGAKKTIVSVVVMALLVNFSLFFTKVVIDSSNVLALIFYNKIEVVGSNDTPITDPTSTGIKEKDVAGALVAGFQVNKFFDPNLIAGLSLKRGAGLSTLGTIGLVSGLTVATFFSGGLALVGAGVAVTSGVSGFQATLDASGVYLVMGMMIAYGFVIYSLTYAFFVAGFSFLGRMIQLIMLMVASPFAFVSYAVPSLKKINTVGFDGWIHSLVSTSFMAAVFLFIIYVIAVIVNADIFVQLADKENQEILAILVLLFVPAILITVLILKATTYARKASGEFTEHIIKGAKVLTGLVGGIAGGLAIGGAAALGQASLGHLGKIAYDNEKWKDKEAFGTKWEKKWYGGLRRIGGGTTGEEGLAGRSYDARKGVAGGVFKAFKTATGIEIGGASKIGAKKVSYVGDLKKRQKRDLEIIEGLRPGEASKEKQKLNKLKESQMLLERANAPAVKEAEHHEADAKEAYEASKRKTRSGPDKGTDGYERNKILEEEARKTYEEARKHTKEVKNGKQLVIDPVTGESTVTGNNEEAWKNTNPEHQELKEAAETVKGFVTQLQEANKEVKKLAEAEKEAVEAMEKAAKDLETKEKAERENPGNDIAREQAETARKTYELAREDSQRQREAYERAEFSSAGIQTKLDTAMKDFKGKEKVAKDAKMKAKKEGTIGYSMSELKDAVEEQQHHMEEVGNERAWQVADNMERSGPFWNRRARRETAHKARMKIKPEKEHESHDDDFSEHLLASAITELAIGGDKHEAPAAKGGDAHPPAHG